MLVPPPGIIKSSLYPHQKVRSIKCQGMWGCVVGERDKVSA
jgi:hypothetical protein